MIDASSTSKTNKRCVVILGAGASVPYGVPATKDLFFCTEARAYLEKESNFKEQIDMFKENFKIKNPENPEELLTYAVESGFKGDPDGLKKFRKHFYIMLKRSIYDGKSTNIPNPPLDAFFEYCHSFRHTTWCNFNWDGILESAYYYYTKKRHNMSIVLNVENYWPEGTLSEKNHLLKLHGGINWRRDESKIDFLRTDKRVKLGTVNYFWENYEKGETENWHPAILEPSAYKYESLKDPEDPRAPKTPKDPIYKQIMPQWKRFADEMKEAHLIIAIGYSYPETDSNMPESPLENINGDAKIVIIDPRANDTANGDLECVRKRYENVVKNHKHHFIPQGYDEATTIEEIEKFWNKTP